MSIFFPYYSWSLETNSGDKTKIEYDTEYTISHKIDANVTLLYDNNVQ
jgi:hypothetical protein